MPALRKKILNAWARWKLIQADAGADLSEIHKTHRGFWILLSGELRLQKRQDDGGFDADWDDERRRNLWRDSFADGQETRKRSSPCSRRPKWSTCVKELFWKLMFACPKVRIGVLGNMAHRLQVFQSQELHREKLISLGTMAAGLMHELNNPGTAARRAASQMRENLGRLQQISLRLCSQDVMTQGQTECLRVLQEMALQPHKPSAMSSMDQADAEDELASWLEEHGIENAWKLAATLSRNRL